MNRHIQADPRRGHQEKERKRRGGLKKKRSQRKKGNTKVVDGLVRHLLAIAVLRESPRGIKKRIVIMISREKIGELR